MNNVPCVQRIPLGSYFATASIDQRLRLFAKETLEAALQFQGYLWSVNVASVTQSQRSIDDFFLIVTERDRVWSVAIESNAEDEIALKKVSFVQLGSPQAPV